MVESIEPLESVLQQSYWLKQLSCQKACCSNPTDRSDLTAGRHAAAILPIEAIEPLEGVLQQSYWLKQSNRWKACCNEALRADWRALCQRRPLKLPEPCYKIAFMFENAIFERNFVTKSELCTILCDLMPILPWYEK